MARRRTSKGRSSAGGFLLFIMGLLVGAGVFYLACQRHPAAEPEDDGRPAATEHGSKSERPTPLPTHPAKTGKETGEEYDQAPTTVVEGGGTTTGKVRAALVIDDLGHSVDEIRALEALGIPLSYAVLPYEDETAAVVAELRRKRVEILCHLPMEPKSGQQDPGPGALRIGMAEAELKRLTQEALAAVPGASGVNNHMGSGLSADESAMRTILGVLSGRGLFFLDSRTSAQSVGYKVAVELGIPAAERQVFLDDDESPSAIDAQFDRFLALARTRGAAVAIGHPHPATLEALARRVPEAKAQGVTFVPVSYLLDRPGDLQ